MSWKNILKERNPFMNKLEKILQTLAKQARSRGIYIEASKDLVSKYIRELEGTEFISVPKIEEIMLEALTAPLNVFQDKLQDKQFQKDLQEIADLGELSVLDEEPDPDMEKFKLTPQQLEAIKRITQVVVNEAIKEVRNIIYNSLDELREDLQDSMEVEEDNEKLMQTETKVKNTLTNLIKDKVFKINYTFNVTQDMIKLGVIERMVIDKTIPLKDKLYPIETDDFSQHFNAFTTKFPDYDWVGKSWSSHLRD